MTKIHYVNVRSCQTIIKRLKTVTSYLSKFITSPVSCGWLSLAPQLDLNPLGDTLLHEFVGHFQRGLTDEERPAPNMDSTTHRLERGREKPAGPRQLSLLPDCGYGVSSSSCSCLMPSLQLWLPENSAFLDCFTQHEKS